MSIISLLIAYASAVVETLLRAFSVLIPAMFTAVMLTHRHHNDLTRRHKTEDIRKRKMISSV